MNTSVICFLSGTILLGAPAAATVISRSSKVPSILLFSFFLVLQQLLFAFAASQVGSYTIGFPIAVVGVLLVGIYLKQRNKTAREGAQPDESIADERWSQLLPWVIFLVVFIPYAAIRARYSYINFNNNGDEAGVEKLFNLSLQQSFLYGRSYPPQWIWLAGEPIRYYVFLKSIPGVASWIARVLFGDPATGGVFFILSEALFGALPAATLCGWLMWFGRRGKHQNTVRAVAIILPLFCFLGTHYHAVSLGIGALLKHSSLDWWSLSHEVVPFTDNQYPIWLMILGDNHAYAQVYFLQILFWGGFLSVVLLEKFSFINSAGLGILAAALVLSHPGSVLVDITVLGAFIVVFAIFYGRAGQWNRLKVCAQHGLVAVFVASFFLCFLFETAGKVKFVVPGKEIVSPLVAFLNLNFSVLLWAGLMFFHPVIIRSILSRIKKSMVSHEWILVLSLILAVAMYICSLPALSVMVVMGYVTYLFLFREDASDTEKILCLFAICSFCIWLPPEIIAFDHTLDSRTDWIRFQMSLRFWPEGYLLIPLALTLAVIERLGERKLSLAWGTCAVGVLIMFFISDIPGVKNRISRSRQAESSIDGFKEFGHRYPADSTIISFLRALPADQHLVIAEACGIGDPRVPVDFAWSGRIAAYSGRTGICGWARHAMLYNNPLRQLGFNGVSVEERMTAYLRSYLGYFSHSLAGDRGQVALDLTELKALGVTHIVFGQYEKNLFPLYSIETAPKDPSVKVIFNASNGMGVLKINE